MKASVIIPNLNGAGWLRDSIESIWAQTEQDFELIVIDNGSTDESLEIARSYCGNSRYHLIENSENTGFSFAEPNWLEELLKTAESDPKIFAVSSLMLRYYEPELADDAGDYMTILGFACKRGDGLKASRYQKPCRIFSACGGAALYRKSILDKIGVFDELFFAYYEDVDLSWRANNAGYKNVLCPTAKCYHICGASTGAVRGRAKSTAAAAATAGSSCTSGSSVLHRFLFIPTPPDTEKQGRLMPSDLAVLLLYLLNQAAFRDLTAPH